MSEIARNLHLIVLRPLPLLLLAAAVSATGCSRVDTAGDPAGDDGKETGTSPPGPGASASAEPTRSALPTDPELLRAVRDLPPRAATEGTLFESLDAAETGIDFRHRWGPPPQYEKQITGSMWSGGVSIGDYDGDGWADVYLARPFDGGPLVPQPR